MHKLEFRAMGTDILVAIDNDAPHVGKELVNVPTWFEVWEQALSRFRPDSELSRLNQVSGQPFRASPLLWDLLQLALETSQVSDGLVSPAFLPALEQAGYRESFERIGATSIGILDTNPFESDLEAIHLAEETRTITLPAGMRLDLGGIAKGWAAHQTMLRLQSLGAILVDAGGDIAVNAPESEKAGWTIDVKDPFDPINPLRTLQLSNGGCATSGRDCRRWQLGGQWQHHIIDPRSGQPAQTDVLAATVIASNTLEAEMAAKVVLILGSQTGLDWLEQREACYGLVVMENRDVIYSRDFEKFLKG